MSHNQNSARITLSQRLCSHFWTEQDRCMGCGLEHEVWHAQGSPKPIPVVRWFLITLAAVAAWFALRWSFGL